MVQAIDNSSLASACHEVQFGDLEFEQVPVRAVTSRGTPFLRWVPVGMPKIPPRVTDGVCYLYRSVEDANAGKEFGGTAFLVYIPSAHLAGNGYVYAVSNWHVAVRGGSSIVRLNTLVVQI